MHQEYRPQPSPACPPFILAEPGSSPFPILLCSSHTCLQPFALMSLHLECPWQLLPILQGSASLTPPPRSLLFCQVSGAGLPPEQLGLGREGTGRILLPGNPGQPIRTWEGWCSWLWDKHGPSVPYPFPSQTLCSSLGICPSLLV